MLFNLLTLAATNDKPLPDMLNIQTDGGDGNWTNATLCFYGLLCKWGVFKRTYLNRCW